MFKFDMHPLVDAQLKMSGLANALKIDAGETLVYSRELEYVHAEVIEAKFAELTWRDLVPIKTGAPLGAEAHRWYDAGAGFGEAKFLDGLALEDFPTVENTGAENTGVIKSAGAKYMVTIQDLRAAQMMRRHVETEKAKNVRRAMETILEKATIGSATTTTGGFKGIAHDDNSTAFTPATEVNGGSEGNWFNAIADGVPMRIVKDLRDATDAAYVETKGAFKSFDVFLCPELDVLLDNPMSLTLNGVTTNLTQSIRQYILANVSRVRSIKGDVNRLSGAGTAAKHRVLIYPRDPEVFDVFIPLDFEQFAPQLNGMAFVTPCHLRYGGLRMKHVKAVRRIDLATAAA